MGGGMRQSLVDKDIQVPRQTQFADDPPHFIGPGLAGLFRNGGAEERQSRTQAPDGHAHLMDALDVFPVLGLVLPRDNKFIVVRHDSGKGLADVLARRDGGG
jgi:hypothetical protein